MGDQMAVILWDVGSLNVSAEVTPNGDVVIAGEDLGHPLCDEYEYRITIRGADVPRLVRALGGDDGAHPLSLLREHAEELITKGEMTWLEEHDIEPVFVNRMGEPRVPDRPVPTAPAPAEWDDFARRLTGVLERLDAGDYLVLESTANQRFVQIAFQDFAIRVESIGEQFLRPSDVLTPEQLNRLGSLGYCPATHSAETDDDAAEGSPNYWMDLPTTTPSADLAELMVNTLRQVHAVESPSQLLYDGARLPDGEIPHPSLGLGRIPQA